MISVAKVLRKIGGSRKLIKLLGYPVNLYSVQMWRRNGCFPEEYRAQIAAHLGITVEDLTPDREGDAPKLEYRKLAQAYAALVRVSGMKTSGLAKLHKVSHLLVEQWRNGYAEPPLQAFTDLYDVMRCTGRRPVGTTWDRALLDTGMTQTEVCRRLGVTPAMGTYWRKRGKIPEVHARKIDEIIREVKAAGQ